MEIQEKPNAWKWIYEYTNSHPELHEKRARLDSAVLMIEQGTEPSLSSEVANISLQIETLDRYSEPSRYYELLASLELVEKTRERAYAIMMESEFIDEDMTQKLETDDARLAKLLGNIRTTLMRRSGQEQQWLNIDQASQMILEVVGVENGHTKETEVINAIMAEDLSTARLQHWISDYLEITVERIQRCKVWFLQDGGSETYHHTTSSQTVIDRICKHVKLQHALKQDI
jgi:hypothetical protein